MAAIDLPARSDGAPDYLRFRDTARCGYYRNEVAQSHRCGARLSGAAMFTNTYVHHPTEIEPTEIEKRP